MNQQHNLGLVVKKIFFFAFIGLLAILLAGPVLTVLSLAISFAVAVIGFTLPFMIVGLIIWIPLRLISRSKDPRWQDLRYSGARVCRSAVSKSVAVSTRACSGAYHVTKGVSSHVGSVSHSVGTVMAEMVCGGLVGLLVGFLVSASIPGRSWTIGIGALVGGFLGILAGASQIRRPVLS